MKVWTKYEVWTRGYLVGWSGSSCVELGTPGVFKIIDQIPRSGGGLSVNLSQNHQCTMKVWTKYEAWTRGYVVGWSRYSCVDRDLQQPPNQVISLLANVAKHSQLEITPTAVE